MAHSRTIVLLAASALALGATPSDASELDASPQVDASQVDPLLAPIPACPAQTRFRASPRVQVRAMACLHRYARRGAGLKPAQRVKRLRISARRKARDLRRCQQFSHTACGRDAFYWFRRVGFMRGNWGAGENLALGTGELGSPRAMMSAWLNSPTHRSVLLNRRFRQFGIGLVRGGYQGNRGAQFWVAHFGYRS